MRTRRPWGIALTASMPLMLFAFSFLLLAGGLLFAFRDFTDVTNLSANKKIPALTATATLVRECEWIRGMSFRLAQSDSELMLTDRLNALRRRIDGLTGTLAELEASGLYPQEILSLKTKMDAFNDIIDALERRVAETLYIRTQYARLTKTLRSLSSQLEYLNMAYPAHLDLDHWNHHVHMSLTLLLVLCCNADMSYGLRVSKEVYAQLGEARTSLERLDASADPKLLPLRGLIHLLYEQLVLSALDEDGVLPLFRKKHHTEQELARLGTRIDRLSDAIVATADDLFAQTRKQTVLSRDGLNQQVSLLSSWLVALIIFSLAVIACTYLYLSKYVITPVIRLNQCMRLRTQQVKTPIPGGGAGEVREMAGSVAFFVNQLEQREQELQRSHDNLEKQVSERTGELNKLSKRLLQAQETERFRLAAELHDDIGATMSVIKFGIERALLILRRKDAEQAQEPLTEAVALVKGLVRQLRRIQYELRPAHIDLGLLNSLEWFCNDYQTAHPHIRLRVRTSFDENALPASLRIVLFRVIQEGLNNIAKYSEAGRAWIAIVSTAQGLTVIVHDDGKGFDLETAGATPGPGLKSMRERVELSGGTFRLDTVPGKGVRIKAHWSGSTLHLYDRDA